MKKYVVDNVPRLCLFTTRQIDPGEEITYSYGTGSYPWRFKVVRNLSVVCMSVKYVS